MRKYRFTRKLAAQWCLLMLGILLLLAACGGSSSPGSQPSQPPPSNGYSIVTLLDKLFLAPGGR